MSSGSEQAAASLTRDLKGLSCDVSAVVRCHPANGYPDLVHMFCKDADDIRDRAHALVAQRFPYVSKTRIFIREQ